MSNEVTVEEAAPTQEQTSKQFDFAKVDALRKHMLLTVESMVVLLNTSRVSYYNWMKSGIKRKKTIEHVRKQVRTLLTIMNKHNWPNEAVFVANQEQRLKMLQELIETLDNQPAE